MNGDAFTVKNVVLRRDAGVLTLSNGTVYLSTAVAGRITGAVFLGEGILHVDPPSAMERRQLRAVMNTEVLDQRFTSAVFNFSDETAVELKKQALAPASASRAAESRAEETTTLFRRDLRYNLEGRLLEDVLRRVVAAFFGGDEGPPLFQAADLRSGPIRRHRHGAGGGRAANLVGVRV